MIGKSLKAMPKGMDEFFSFIRLLSDDTSYQEKAAKLADQIARSEELVGARDTLDKAEAYFAEANKERIQAEALRMQAEKDCAEQRARVTSELGALRDKAERDAEVAARRAKDATDRDETSRIREQEASQSLARRERDVTQREKSVAAREEALARREKELSDKAAQVKALFG